MSQNQVNKLEEHLTLLKQEYAKLQIKYEEMEAKYNAMAATNRTEDTFTSRLLQTVQNLHNSSNYSDLRIRLVDDRTIPAHRIVLAARSPLWADLTVGELDWSDVGGETAEAIILWLYTSKIRFQAEGETVRIIRKAFEFGLGALVESCERYLIGIVTIRSCVRFYSVAEEVQAENLREYCSGMIGTYWDELNATDFEHMSGPLLYQMLKSKTQLVLHTAVRLQREDVVFLCLVENASKLPDLVNAWSPAGELPLDLAVRAHHAPLAATLLQHGADPDRRDAAGDTLLLRALRRGDAAGALLLLERGADPALGSRPAGAAPLHLAAALPAGGGELAAQLARRGAPPNAPDARGRTPLMAAARAANADVLGVLLAQPLVEVDGRAADGHAAVHDALVQYEAGRGACLAELMERGPKVDLVYEAMGGASLLQVLIEAGHEKAAIYLCDHVKLLNHINEAGETALHFGCSKNKSELTRKLLELGAEPNVQTMELRRTPLHYAVTENAVNCIEVMVEFASTCNIDFNLRDANGDTAICLALEGDLRELVPVLIRGGADVNVRNGKDLTLLHQAILKQDTETALFLVQNGADINAKTADSESSLQLAIHCRLPDVVDALCAQGVDMAAPDRLGDCALWTALDSEQEAIAAILVRHGADTDCWAATGPEGCNQTLLHRAIDENKETIAIFLIQSGCDINSPRLPGPANAGGPESRDGATPLHLCAEWGLAPVARALVEHRAAVNARDALGRTALHLAVSARQPAVVGLLLGAPALDLAQRDAAGRTAFACALDARDNKAAEAILARLPAAAEQFDARGRNFLHVAIRKGDMESALFLLTVNVDVNSRVQDASLTPPIHLAARFGSETLVRSLILAGARVDDRDAQKKTALHIAAEVGNAAAVSAILQNQGNFDALDVENDNALHIAVREGHLSVVRALLTESSIDAEAVNLKGRNPLHELCRYGKDNAAAICELFLECMPDYPINKTDINGNSPLLLAYMKGNGNLCRVLVKANACLGTENADRITIFNYQVPSRQLLTRLLDQLGRPAVWTSTDLCQECGKCFAITVRTHHCRHCGRALCSKCSDQEVPIIKFGEHKPVRVCRVCFDVLKMGGV